MKLFGKAYRKIIDIAVVILVIFSLVLLISNYFGFNLYVVRSGSMEPNIHTGSLAIVYERADFYSMEVGDVVAFKLVNGELVTHRIEEITKLDGITYFLTKGDANEVSDGYTTNIQNFYGETIYSLPGVGYVADWVTSKFGKWVLIGIAGMLAILYWLCNDDEEEEVEAEYEEIVEYIEIDENGNEILIGSTISIEDEPAVEPPILCYEENGEVIECTGEDEKHEDDPPIDEIQEEIPDNIEGTDNEEVVEEDQEEELAETDVEAEEVKEEGNIEDEQEEIIKPVE